MNILAQVMEVIWPKTTTKEIKPKKAKKSTKKKTTKKKKKKLQKNRV